MLRRDRRGHARADAAHELHAVPCRHVLEHDAQPREAPHEAGEHAIDEGGLAVEDVDVRVGHLAMHQQRQIMRLERRERGINLVDRGNARIGVRRRARRVILDGVHEPARLGASDLGGAGIVGQVQRHQRREARAGGQRSENALAVGRGKCRRRHRWSEVRHHDCAREPCCAVTDDGGERRAVAQVQMPVVRASQRQLHRRRAPREIARRNALSDSSAAPKRTPKPVVGVDTWASPPLRSAADRSTCSQGMPAPTKRARKRAA